MKKIALFIMTLVFFAGASFGQASTLKTSSTGVYATSYTKTIDTVTNATDTSYFFFSGANMKNGSAELIARNVSGTCVLTAYLEVSSGGNNKYGYWQKATGDTINLKPAANAVKAGGWIISATTSSTISQSNVAYYRIRIVGHANGACQVSGYSYNKRD